MTVVSEEIESRPELWRRAAALAVQEAAVLPERGARGALFGCGTSLYVEQPIAAAREAAGHGETDAFPASEMPAGAPLRLCGRGVAVRHDHRGPGTSIVLER